MNTRNVFAGSVRHVLLVHVDQMRWDAAGFAGGQAITPNLDRLAINGKIFNNAHAQSPVCMPSRISMFAGKYPSALQIEQMGIPAPENLQTLPSVLRGSGFRTAIVGKLHFLPHANRDHSIPHPDFGFDHLEISEEPGVYNDAYLTWVANNHPSHLDRVSFGDSPAAKSWSQLFEGNSSSDNQGRKDYEDVYLTDNQDCSHSAWVGTRVSEIVQSIEGSGRSFTVASFFSPHSPYYVPENYWNLYDKVDIKPPVFEDSDRATDIENFPDTEHVKKLKKGYFASISEVDNQVGRILKAYEAKGLEKELLVVFTSDHGDWLGDYHLFSKGFPANDPVTRVPLVFSGAGVAVGISEQIVELVSVAPTVLSLCGVVKPSDMQALPLSTSLKDAQNPDSALAITEHAGWRSLRAHDYRYLSTQSGEEKLQLVSAGRDCGEVLNEDNHPAMFLRARKDLIKKMIAVSRIVPKQWPY